MTRFLFGVIAGLAAGIMIFSTLVERLEEEEAEMRE